MIEAMPFCYVIFWLLIYDTIWCETKPERSDESYDERKIGTLRAECRQNTCIYDRLNRYDSIDR